MRYIEARFYADDEEVQEILVSILDSFNFEGFEYDDECLKAFIPMPDFELFNWQALQAEVPAFADIRLETSIIEETNWNEVWESGFTPVRVKDKVYIRASFHPTDPTVPYELLIDPKMSFGTGHHETTSMMVEAMLTEDFTDAAVLDFGSGTGILAILAAQMKAASVVAVDHEHWAYENALENVRNNNVLGVVVLEGDEQVIPIAQYNHILANVNKNVIFQNLSFLVNLLPTGGLIYLSGLLKTDKEATLKLAQSLDLTLRLELEQGNWICLKLSK